MRSVCRLRGVAEGKKILPHVAVNYGAKGGVRSAAEGPRIER
jgi:hypothetical protein